MTDERLDRMIGDVLADRAEEVAAATASADAMAELVTTRLRPGRLGRGWALLATALLAAFLIAGALTVGGVLRLPPLPSPPSVPLEWTGPLRPNSNAMPVIPSETVRWTDGPDAAVDWIDIEAVRVEGVVPTRWTLDLAEFPPRASTLDPAHQVIEYGVVLDTSSDGVADFLIGISTDVPESGGDFRAWVTNLATGNTRENVGPSYGFPIEFSHPGEQPTDGSLGAPSMVFTFLPGSAPIELYASYATTGSVRYYAWASMTDAGRVTAWDYAPDAGWLDAPMEKQP